jgi:hypothetical protein
VSVSGALSHVHIQCGLQKDVFSECLMSLMRGRDGSHEIPSKWQMMSKDTDEGFWFG